MDLYYRLNVIQLTVPPLRNRPQDILPLAHFFMEQFKAKFKRPVNDISAEGECALLAHDWPGNVRELRNAIQRAMILEESNCIGAVSLNLLVRDHEPTIDSHVADDNSSFLLQGPTLAGHERRLLVQSLERMSGNQTKAAKFLGITRDAMRYKMKKHELQ